MLNISLLISTVNQNICTNHSLLHFDYLKSTEMVVIQQVMDGHHLDLNNHVVYSYPEKGLSKSRNKAIDHATGDICLLVDDDVKFLNNFEHSILESFSKYPDVDIITFQVATPDGGLYKKYSNDVYVHSLKTIFSVSSIEIAFRRSSIVESNIRFDERFGLGATYDLGEEVVFLSDALKKGLKILSVPIPICIHEHDSSGKEQTLKKTFSRGAVFYRLLGKKAFFFNLFYTFYKRKFYTKNISMFMYLKHLMKGSLSMYKESF